MNEILTPDQIADLAGISQLCEELGAELVVIGATSLLILMGDLGRSTRDVDLTVAVDFDEFERLTLPLATIGWTPAPKLEHRWIAPRRTIIGLLPAGAETPSQRFHHLARESVQDEPGRFRSRVHQRSRSQSDGRNDDPRRAADRHGPSQDHCVGR